MRSFLVFIIILQVFLRYLYVEWIKYNNESNYEDSIYNFVMILDKYHRALQKGWPQKISSIKNDDLKELLDDICTFDNIDPFNSDSFISGRVTWFSEANLELRNAVEAFDLGNFTGGYGNLKAASEILLSILYIFAGKDEAVTNSRKRSWSKPDNDFRKMIIDHKSWKNFKLIMDTFESYKAVQNECDKRINKSRHKHSSIFFENIRRENNKKWKEDRLSNSIKDIKFTVSTFIIVWVVLSPELLISSSEMFMNRIPQALIAFPKKELAGKYVPEVLVDSFLESSEVTKDVYKKIKSMYKMTPEQRTFVGDRLIVWNLEIKNDVRKNFDISILCIYDSVIKDRGRKYNTFIIIGDYNFYHKPNGGVLNRKSNMWEDKIEESTFWKSEIIDMDYKIDEYEDKKVLCFNSKGLFEITSGEGKPKSFVHLKKI